jgi:hypothetical protein
MTASEFDSDSFARGNGPDRAVSIGTWHIHDVTRKMCSRKLRQMSKNLKIERKLNVRLQHNYRTRWRQDTPRSTCSGLFLSSRDVTQNINSGNGGQQQKTVSTYIQSKEDDFHDRTDALLWRWVIVKAHGLGHVDIWYRIRRVCCNNRTGHDC